MVGSVHEVNIDDVNYENPACFSGAGVVKMLKYHRLDWIG